MTRSRLALIQSLAWLVATAVLPAAALAQARPTDARNVNIWSPKYDVRLEVLPDGSIDVAETVTLSVGAKPMTWFDRRVPGRRTDGITNVVATMDGRDVPVAITYDRDGDLKVRWEFSPTANATHTFQMQYRAVHVLAREIEGPRLLWTALPTRHTYPIDAAEVSVFAPAGSVAKSVDAIGGSVMPPTAERPGVVIAATSLPKDRAVGVDITFAPNSIRPAEPQWLIKSQRQREMLPAWVAAALCLVAIGGGILVMMFVRLPKAVAADAGEFVTPATEGSVPPALVTLLLGRGQTTSGFALQSAFFRLVRDGHLTIAKRGEHSRWRGQAFDVAVNAAPSPSGQAIAPHEAVILETIRAEGAHADMARTMGRMARRQRGFRDALMAEATTRGWIDAERKQARSGLLVTGFVLMAVGLVGALALLLLINNLGPAPVLLPGALLIVGVVFGLVSASMSMLSEAGAREAARWMARVAELKATIKGGASGRSTEEFERWFPLAIGAGIGSRWLKVFDAQLLASGANIGWLKAMGSPADAARSLAMMVAVTGSSSSGGGGSAGGAGGGSSGAG